MNRSQFRKFGIKVAELVATMRARQRRGDWPPRDLRGKRYWLVGATEGLGLALAQKLSAAGAEVILSARSAERLAEVVGQPARHRRRRCRWMWPTDGVGPCRGAGGWARSTAWSSSPGVYWPMRAQDWDAKSGRGDVRREFHRLHPRVIGAVLPGMVARGQGPCRHHRLAVGLSRPAGRHRLCGASKAGRDGAGGIDVGRPAQDRHHGAGGQSRLHPHPPDRRRTISPCPS